MPHTADAGTDSWKIAGNGNWNIAPNWSTGLVPTSADDATFALGSSGGYTASVTASTPVKDLVVSNDNVTVSVSSGQTLSVGTDIYVGGSPTALGSPSTLTIAGTGNVSTGSYPSVVFVETGSTLNVNGTLSTPVLSMPYNGDGTSTVNITGTLNVSSNFAVGYGGSGNVRQTGGTTTIGSLGLGNGTSNNTTSSYTLSNAGTGLNVQQLTIGQGQGATFTQFDGQTNISSGFSMGEGANGLYQLYGGTLNFNGYQAETIGDYTQGVITQLAGTHNVGSSANPQNLNLGTTGHGGSGQYSMDGSEAVLAVSGNLIVGSATGSSLVVAVGNATVAGTTQISNAGSSSLSLLGGSLTTGTLDLQGTSSDLYWIGGSLILTGSGSGTNNLGANFNIGHAPVNGTTVNSCTFNFQGGTLNLTGTQTLGTSTQQSFANQTGGTQNLGALTIYGSYELLNNGSVLNVAGNEDIAPTTGSVPAGFYQYGGTHTVGGNLIIGDEGETNYTLYSGTLAVTGNEYIANATDGGAFYTSSFTQQSGTHTISGSLYVADLATYNANGIFTINGGSLTVSGSVYLGGDLTQVSDANADVTINTGANVTVAGTLLIDETGANESRVNLAGGNLSAGSISGNGGIFNWTSGNFTVTGTAGLTVSSVDALQGAFNVIAGKNLTVTNTLTIPAVYDPNNGLSLAGGSITAGAINQFPHFTSGTLSITGSGGYTVSSGNSITLGAGQIFNVTNTLTNNGTVNLSGGVITVGSLAGSFPNFTAGALSVTGTNGYTNPTGSSITLNTGQTFNVLNTLTNNGTITLNGGSIYYGTLVGYNLVWNSGTVTVPTISTTLTLSTGQTLGTSGSLITVSPTGSITVNSGGTISGNIQNSGGSITYNVNYNIPNNGMYTQTGGNATINGTFAVGTSGTIGSASVSSGNFNASTILLGSPGGSGTMTVSGTAAVTVGGGLSINDYIQNGGSTTILTTSVAGEDSELYQAMVGGYQHNGAFELNAGTVTTPYLKLGITAGCIGTYQQTGGTLNVTSEMGVGYDTGNGTGSGIGVANFSGGMTNAAALAVGSFNGGTGSVNMMPGGALNVSGGTYVLNGNVIQTGGTFNTGSTQMNYGSSSWQISGGTTTITGDLQSGVNPGANTFVLISGSGTFNVTNTEYIGGAYSSTFTGTGNVIQTGGTNTAGNQMLVGYQAGGAGYYTISGGNLNVNSYLTVGSAGVFNQSGGAVKVLVASNVADLQVSGIYNLTSGDVQAVGLYLGGMAAAVFNQTGGTAEFNSIVLGNSPGQTGTYNLAGGVTTAINSQIGSAASGGNFLLGPAGTLALSSTFTNFGTTTINGTLNFSSGATFTNSAGVTTLNTDVGTAGAKPAVTVAGGTVNFNTSQHLSILIISSGVTATLNGAGAGHRSMLYATGMTLLGSLDLTGNDLDDQNGGVGGLTAVTGYLKSGYSNGTWTGIGMDSSLAAANPGHLTALGVTLESTNTTLDSLPVAANDVVVKYTWYGDATLDGKVDGSDYSRIDSGYLNHLTGWFNGDFNYDGVVNGSDYTLMDNTFNQQGAQLTAEVAAPTSRIAESGGTAAVPEPAGVGLLIVAAKSLLGRRRQQRA